MNNHHNKVVTLEDINVLLDSYTTTRKPVKDLSLYINSFIHKSCFTYDGTSCQEDIYCVFDKNFLNNLECNERLEFFGDSCLNLICAEYLYEKFPKEDEGFLTKLRSKMVRNTQLANLAKCLGFDNWLLISYHIETLGGRSNLRLLEDVFESFIGALYKDQGFYICREFIFNIFNTHINIQELILDNSNYKDILLRYFHEKRWPHPSYILLSESGTSSKKIFISCVLLPKNTENLKSIDDKAIKNSYNIKDEDNYYLSVGEGKTKKISEQNASKNCMKILNIPQNF